MTYCANGIHWFKWDWSCDNLFGTVWKYRNKAHFPWIDLPISKGKLFAYPMAVNIINVWVKTQWIASFYLISFCLWRRHLVSIPSAVYMEETAIGPMPRARSAHVQASPAVKSEGHVWFTTDSPKIYRPLFHGSCAEATIIMAILSLYPHLPHLL